MMDEIFELAILNRNVDKMGTRVRRTHPALGELLLEAGDLLYQVGKQMAVISDGQELTACEACGMTVEDGECVCVNDPAWD